MSSDPSTEFGFVPVQDASPSQMSAAFAERKWPGLEDRVREICDDNECRVTDLPDEFVGDV